MARAPALFFSLELLLSTNLQQFLLFLILLFYLFISSRADVNKSKITKKQTIFPLVSFFYVFICLIIYYNTFEKGEGPDPRISHFHSFFLQKKLGSGPPGPHPGSDPAHTYTRTHTLFIPSLMCMSSI